MIRKEPVPRSGEDVVRVIVAVGEPPVPSTGEVPAASAYVAHPVVADSASGFEI